MPGLLRTSVEVTVTVTSTVTKGRAVFSYRLTNIGDAALGEFALAVPTGAALRAPSGPPGWLIRHDPGDGRLVWQSLAPAMDLVPGGSLAGFRFRAADRAGPAAYHVRHFADDGHTACRGGGVTQAPIASASPFPDEDQPGKGGNVSLSCESHTRALPANIIAIASTRRRRATPTRRPDHEAAPPIATRTPDAAQPSAPEHHTEKKVTPCLRHTNAPPGATPPGF